MNGLKLVDRLTSRPWFCEKIGRVLRSVTVEWDIHFLYSYTSWAQIREKKEKKAWFSSQSYAWLIQFYVRSSSDPMNNKFVEWNVVSNSIQASH